MHLLNQLWRKAILLVRLSYCSNDTRRDYLDMSRLLDELLIGKRIRTVLTPREFETARLPSFPLTLQARALGLFAAPVFFPLAPTAFGEGILTFWLAA